MTLKMLLFCFTVLFALCLAKEEEECSKKCKKHNCLFGICLNCESGYFGRDCDPCLPNCLDGRCVYNDSCSWGCLDGWYGSGCDQICDCDGEGCDQELGTCPNHDVDTCLNGICSEECEQNCEHEEEDEESPLSPGMIIVIIIVCLTVMNTVYCCCKKRGPKTTTTAEEVTAKDTDFIPPSQKLIPGATTNSFSSSNMTFPHTAQPHGYLDQYNVIVYQNPNPQCHGTSESSQRGIQATIPPRSNDQNCPPSYNSLNNQCVVHAEIPPMPIHQDSPPSYDSLDNQCAILADIQPLQTDGDCPPSYDSLSVKTVSEK